MNKKLFATAVLVLASVAAFATPNPKQVESALAAHDYRTARSLVDEVLRDLPQSARAHLLNSYVLLKEGRADLAASEVSLARKLDRKGDVTSSALFGRTVAEIDAARTRPAPVVAYTPPPQQEFSPPAYVAPAPAPEPKNEGHGALFWLFMLVLVGGAGYGIYFLVKKNEETKTGSSAQGFDGFILPENPTVPPAPPLAPAPQRELASSIQPQSTYATRPGPRLQVAAAPVQPQVVVVHDRPVGIDPLTGMLGTAAGVGVGILAADALINAGHRRRVEEDAYEAGLNRGRRDSSGYSSSGASTGWDTPTPTPAPTVATVDFETERASFSSGRDEEQWTPAPAPVESFSSSRDEQWTPAPAPVESFSSSRDDDRSSSSSDSSSSSSDSSSSSSDSISSDSW